MLEPSYRLHLRSLAELYAKLGRLLDGLKSLDEVVQIIETTNERRDEAKLHRIRGDLLIAMCDHAAEQCCHQALIISERQRARAFELRAAPSLARLWRDQGKRTEARALLAPIYGWFTEGFDRSLKMQSRTGVPLPTYGPPLSWSAAAGR
jgi:hypothetical protein